MRRTLFAIAPLLLSACYLDHGRGDPGRADAAPVVRDDGGTALTTCALAAIADVVVRAPETHGAQAPDVFFTGTEVGVVMMEGGGSLGHSIVTMAHVSADLRRVSEVRTIGEEAHGWGEADFGGDGLTLCWSGDPGGPGRTLLRRVLESGAVLGPRRDHDGEGEACLDLVIGRDRALVAWRHRVAIDDDFVIETRAQLVSLDGEPLADPIVLASSEYPGRSADLFATEDGFLAAIAPETGSVRVLALALDGSVRADRTFAVPDARGAVIAAAHERIGVVIGMGPVEVRSLAFLALDERLAPIGEPRRISDGAPSALGASIEPLSDGWLVTFADAHQPSTAVTLLHLDPSGLAREPRVRAHRGSNSGYGGPSVVVAGDDAYVAFSRSSSSAPDDVMLQSWRCEPRSVDACRPDELVEGDCDTDERPLWRWTGSGCAPVSCPSACSGPGCARLSASRFECASDHAHCAGAPTCDGGLAGSSVDRACIESRVLGEEDPMRIHVTRALVCPCGATLRCDVRVEAPFSLALDTSLCTPPIDCDCGPELATLGATCELPPLSAGTWTVSAPGLAPFEIEVKPPWERPEPSRFCTTP